MAIGARPSCSISACDCDTRSTKALVPKQGTIKCLSWDELQKRKNTQIAERKLRMKTQTKTRKLSYRKDDLAMRPIYGCPDNFREFLSTPTATFARSIL